MKSNNSKKGSLDQKITTKIIAVFVVSMVLVVSISVGVAIISYQSNNQDVALTQSKFSLDALDNQLEIQKSSALNYTVQLSHNSDLVNAVEVQNDVQLDKTVMELAQYTDLDFITVMDLNGRVIIDSAQLHVKGDDLHSEALVVASLSGKIGVEYKVAAENQFYILAAAPLKSKEGQFVGSISAGYNLSSNELVDLIKTLYGTDVTIFAGDVRVSTTIVKDGARLLGTTLNPDIAEIVLNQKQEYFGEADILEIPYITAYRPILDSEGKSLGLIFSGKAMAVTNDQVKETVMKSILLAIASLVVFALLIVVFLKKSLSVPLKNLSDVADRIALGDTDFEIKITNKDEIGAVMESFHKMMITIREQADIVDRIASGDLELEIKPRSEKDKLAYSMISVSNTLNNLVAEAASMTTAAVEGKLSTRGDANAFQGGYQKIVTGFNQTLDAVVNPLNVAASYIEQIGKGEIPSKITDTYYGDFNEIKDNINACIDGLGALTEGEFVLGKMSENDYSEKVKGDYLGIFNDISQSINTVTDQVNIVMGDIGEAADQVASGSTQVADGSQALSQGSTEQASSIQQLTASITEIASQTKENAVNANQASELATDSRDKAIKGNEQMKEMQNSMAEINQSSSNISKIIKVIDDIAFQTNILALNAAVEAARAGQHGKGFAVVAEEVRTLAARSAEAARNTTDLIEGSIAKAQVGTNIANQTAEALNEIVIGIEKAAVLVGTIATASNEQASGIAEINKGIEQVSQVVQSNSATAEESAAASEELTSQAEQLKGMVGRFKLMNSERLDERKTKLLGSSSTKSEPVHKADSNPKIILSDNEFDKY